MNRVDKRTKRRERVEKRGEEEMNREGRERQTKRRGRDESRGEGETNLKATIILHTTVRSYCTLKDNSARPVAHSHKAHSHWTYLDVIGSKVACGLVINKIT